MTLIAITTPALGASTVLSAAPTFDSIVAASLTEVAPQAVGSTFADVAASALSTAATSFLFSTAHDTSGPRLENLKVTGASYGVPIRKIYGTARSSGNIIWARPIKETEHITSVGKGGGSSSYTTYTYSASFAVGMCEGELGAVRRVWADSKLLADFSDTAPVSSIVQSERLGLTIYTGSETQTPDPTIESFEGVGNTPAYRGLAYIVFNDLQLADYGNRIPNITFEVSQAPSAIVSSFLNYGEVSGERYYWRVYKYDENTTRVMLQEYPVRNVYAGETIRNPALSQIFAHTYIDFVTDTLEKVGNGIVTINPPPEDLSNIRWQCDSGAYAYGEGPWTSADAAMSAVITRWQETWGTHCYDIYQTHDFRYTINWSCGASGGNYIYAIDEFGNAFSGHRLPPSMKTTIPMGQYPYNVLTTDGSLYGCRYVYGMYGGNLVFTDEYSTVNSPAISIPIELPDQYLVDTVVVNDSMDALLITGKGDASYGSVLIYSLDILNGTSSLVKAINNDSGFNPGLSNVGNAYFDSRRLAFVIYVTNSGTQHWMYLISYYKVVSKESALLSVILTELCAYCSVPVNTSSLTQQVRGFVIQNPMTVRDAVMPLLGAFNVSGYEVDYNLEFTAKDGIPDRVVLEDNLAAVEEDRGDRDKVKFTRIQELELPEIVETRYLDIDADYQQGSQLSRDEGLTRG